MSVLSFIALFCATAHAQGWSEMSSTQFGQLDGSTVELTASEDVPKRLVRIQLKKSGGHTGESRKRSMVLSIEEAELFLRKGVELLGDGDATPTFIVATKQGDTLIYKKNNDTEGIYLTLGIYAKTDRLDGVRTAIGFQEGDYSNFRAVLRVLELNLMKYTDT